MAEYAPLIQTFIFFLLEALNPAYRSFLLLSNENTHERVQTVEFREDWMKGASTLRC